VASANRNDDEQCYCAVWRHSNAPALQGSYYISDSVAWRGASFHSNLSAGLSSAWRVLTSSPMSALGRSRRHPAAVTLPLLRVETGGPAPAQAGQTTALQLVCHPTNRTSSAGIPPSRPKPAAQSKPAESHPLALDISLTPTS